MAIKFDQYNGVQKGSLIVSVKEANGLPQMNSHGLTDAAVRLLLLPRYSFVAKKKTACIKNSVDPVWNEQFEYRNVTIPELRACRVLELSVWDYDRKGCNDFIGCVRLGPSPGDADKRCIDWVNSNINEAEHWTEMLNRPGEWVEAWHNLLPSIGKRFDSDGGDLPILKDSQSLVATSKNGELKKSKDAQPLVASAETKDVTKASDEVENEVLL